MVDQIENNTQEQVMLGDFPEALRDALMDSVGNHNGMAKQLLRDNGLWQEFALFMLGAIYKERQQAEKL